MPSLTLPKHFVADVVVEGGVEAWHGHRSFSASSSKQRRLGGRGRTLVVVAQCTPQSPGKELLMLNGFTLTLDFPFLAS
jgi:hypothetical protein